MSELKEIKLYGALGQKYGKIHHFAVASAGEAVRALKANFKGFEQDVINFSGGFRVFVDHEEITEKPEIFTLARRSIRSIRIVPVVAGSKSGFVPLLLGAALIVLTSGTAGAFLLGTQAATMGGVLGAAGLGATAVSIIGGIGVSLALNGIAQLLSPTPKNKNSTQAGNTSNPSYSFNGPINTTQQGLPVPVFYGELTIGSAMISAGVTVTNIPL